VNRLLDNYNQIAQSYYTGLINYDWCQATGIWQVAGTACSDSNCETDGMMKADFVNFVLNITLQSQRSLNSNDRQGFCAVDLQPLFDDSFKQARSDWAAIEFVSGTLPATTQKAFKLTSLAEYVLLPSETATGVVDHIVTITWVLIYPFSSITDLAAFKADLQTDFANSLGIPASRIVIDVVSTSSFMHIMTTTSKINVVFHITPSTTSTDPTAVVLSQRLQAQFADPTSVVYQGKYTQYTDSTSSPNVVITGAGASLSPSYLFALVAVVLALFFSK